MIKIKLIFGAINTVLYPLVIFVIAPFIHFIPRKGGGGGPNFDLLEAIFFGVVILLVVSMILAHLITRSWWIGLVSLVLGLFTSWAGYVGVESLERFYDENKISKYVEYYDTGEIMEKGRKRGGDKNGKVIKYYRNGTVKSIETFKRGILFGSCELNHRSGKLMAKGSFKGSKPNRRDDIGIFDGSWSIYHENGRLDDQRTYDQGKLLSSKSYKLCFDSAGLVRTIADGELYSGSLVKQGILLDTYLFTNLYTTQVKNGELDGDLCSYYVMGDNLVVASTSTYRNGKRDGALKSYYTNGELETDAFYVDGNLEGIYTSYHVDSVAATPHGKVEYICNYKNGERHGTARWYNDDGTLKQETEYSHGKQHGILRKYRSDGRLLYVYNYQNDQKDGAYEDYDFDDGGSEKGRYESDQKIYFKRYNADGTIKEIWPSSDDE